MRAYANVPRDSAVEARIQEYAGMARRIALRLARKVPAWIDREDLIATAMLGLTEAAARFDATRGEPFVAFAERRIRGAVLDELRRGDILPRRVRITARKIGATIAQLEQKLGRDPEDEEIAAALDVPVDQYKEELEILTHVSFVELDKVALEHERTTEEQSPFAMLDRKQMQARIQKGIESLPERDATVLSLYYVESLTYSEIGQVLGVSESRVCQLQSRALTRLRAAIETETEQQERKPERRARP